MAKTVVGLFDDLNDAQNVSGELGRVRNTDVNLVSRDVYSGSDSDISDMVTGAGVPSSDARLYVEGVRQGSTLVVAQTDDNQVNDVVDIMNRYNIVDIESRRSMYSGSDATVGASADVTRASLNTTDVDTSYVDTTPSMSTTSTTGYSDTTRTRGTVDAGDEIAVPIVEEELRVGKREVETGGVRVNTRVEEIPVNEQVQVRDEHVEVERRRVDQPLTDATTAFQEGTFEVTETDEEVIVDKQARVVEEVVIRKDVDQRTETISDTVRRTDVDVEQVPGTTRTSGTTTTGTVSSADYTTGTTGTGSTRGTTGTSGTGGGVMDRIEGATGLDIDRDSDVGGRPRNS